MGHNQNETPLPTHRADETDRFSIRGDDMDSASGHEGLKSSVKATRA